MKNVQFLKIVLPVNSEVLVHLKDVASVSWDILSDFLNQAPHILQIQSSSLNAYAFLTKV
jgi:hypothetical protein